MLTEDARQDVETFFKLHEERVRIYKKLESGHRDLLAAPADQGETSDGTTPATTDPFPAYRAAVAEATDGFSSVSQRVLALLARMRNQPTAQECTDAVERIQELERRKLQMTCEMQLLAFQQRQEPEDAVRERTLRHLRQQHATLIEDITDCLRTLRSELYD
ncbi:Required for excision 1-B domain-containing protein [Amphibalanus amphitrite]|uniref:Required for excision 1-B domain-containing protein n=1 Tax=Amphibalanus amphitrite TaxID=1232801 RepID=A0A6A4WB56_AMPAM|nr:uncharacterized protein LOC122385798 [Amphibalanus amphitrite]KAF0300880.1 Required for excision 1-B domain-containing protein [Amphibalanus amphitrite]